MESTTLPLVDNLIERYGFHLEKMELEDKLALRLTLASYIYFLKIVADPDDDSYTLADAFKDAILTRNDATSYDFGEIILPTLQGISTYDAEELIAAITAQLGGRIS